MEQEQTENCWYLPTILVPSKLLKLRTKIKNLVDRIIRTTSRQIHLFKYSKHHSHIFLCSSSTMQTNSRFWPFTVTYKVRFSNHQTPEEEGIHTEFM